MADVIEGYEWTVMDIGQNRHGCSAKGSSQIRQGDCAADDSAPFGFEERVNQASAGCRDGRQASGFQQFTPIHRD
jgi:hypothetical protein